MKRFYPPPPESMKDVQLIRMDAFSPIKEILPPGTISSTECVKRYKEAREKDPLSDWGGHALQEFMHFLFEDKGWHGTYDSDYYNITIISSCYCDKWDCPWCSFDAPYFRIYTSKDNDEEPFDVWWYKHPGRNLRTNRPYQAPEVNAWREAVEKLTWEKLS